MPLPTIPSGNVNSGLATGFNVANSCRFDGTSAYLHKSTSSGTNTKFTFSAWIKRSSSGSQYPRILGSHTDASNYLRLNWNRAVDGEQLHLYSDGVGTLLTNRLFRDPNAWMHILVAVDTTDSTANDRQKIFINGSQETSFATRTNPSLNADYNINNASSTLTVGKKSFPSEASDFFDGYMAEVHYIDGTAYAPTDFGEYDEDSPTIWKPKKVSGITYGTNGFYLDFKDSSNLGNDANSGTDLTEVNLAATDQSTDTCTNNFCTMNPLSAGVGDVNRIPTFAEGNLKFTASSATFCQAISTFGVDQGKWYYEVKVISSTHLDKLRVGLWNIDKNVSSGEIQDVSSADSGVFFVNKDGGEMRLNATNTTADYGTFAQNDIMGVANDIDNRTISIYKNGSVIVNAYDYSGGISSGTVLTPAFMGHTNTSFEINFGSPPYSESGGNSDGNGYGNFAGSVPSGYYALNSKNLAEYG